MQDIILYTTHCPRCKALEEKLNTANIKYVEETNVEKMLSLGIETIPMLSIDGGLMNFTESVNWIKEATNS